MPTLARVCGIAGCPEDRPCRIHAKRSDPLSSRNHRGVPRQARGLGAEHDRNVRALQSTRQACELRLPGCTGVATSPEHRLKRSAGGTNDPANIGGACVHCQNVQGGRIAAASRVR